MAFILKLLIKWAVVSGVFAVVALAAPGIKVRSKAMLPVMAVTFGAANVLLGWLLSSILGVVLVLPMILTLGLIGLLIPIAVNAGLLKAVDLKFGDKLEIQGMKLLLVTATVISVAGFIVDQVM